MEFGKTVDVRITRSNSDMVFIDTKNPQYCLGVSKQILEQLETFARQTLVPASDLSRLRAGGHDDPTSWTRWLTVVFSPVFAVVGLCSTDVNNAQNFWSKLILWQLKASEFTWLGYWFDGKSIFYPVKIVKNNKLIPTIMGLWGKLFNWKWRKNPKYRKFNEYDQPPLNSYSRRKKDAKPWSEICW